MHINSQSYSQLLIEGIPMMDVRAPVEFQRGAFPSATNLPLMDDSQRETVGKCYKQHGQETAIKKGHQLVSGELRDARIAAWVDFAKRNPQGLLYCFRGGLRSKITQQWLKEAGVEFPRIDGGYKALRTFLIGELDSAAENGTYHLVGGRTGSAKTGLVNSLVNGIDLEGAAFHRGSSFGSHAKEQNNQINFENILAIDFLKLRDNDISNIVLEDEGRTIGRVGIPKALYLKMRSSPLVVVEMPVSDRLERLIQEYVVDMQAEFEAQCADNAFAAFSDYLLKGLERIQKRLGLEQYEITRNVMTQALEHHRKTGDIGQHYDWLDILLKRYYDPLYDYGLNKRKELVCFRGDYTACVEYLQASQ
ncbi:MAG: tRNA 2-selenouridine(34) synthase MnmH [Gammaproteobacteria bacterium]